MTAIRCACGTLTERPGPCARCTRVAQVDSLDRALIDEAIRSRRCGYCLDPAHTIGSCPWVWLA